MKTFEGSLILFKDDRTLRTIMDVVQAATGLPEFWYSSKDTGGHKCRGLGFLDDVRKFYDEIGLPWAAESWQGAWRQKGGNDEDSTGR